jgi:hypothetical protein
MPFKISSDKVPDHEMSMKEIMSAWHPQEWSTTSAIIFKYIESGSDAPVFKVVGFVNDIAAIKKYHNKQVYMPLGTTTVNLLGPSAWILINCARFWYRLGSGKDVMPEWDVYVQSIMEMIQTLIHGVSENLGVNDPNRTRKLAAAFDLMAQLQVQCDRSIWCHASYSVRTFVQHAMALSRPGTYTHTLAAILLNAPLKEESITRMVDMQTQFGPLVFMPVVGSWYKFKTMFDSRAKSIGVLREATMWHEFHTTMYRRA